MLKYASLVEWTLIFVLTIVRYSPSAYNIDLNSAEVFRDPVSLLSCKRKSYFGFSVALYVGANESVLLVGAPRANSSELQFVTEPGTVFQCKINDVKRGCIEWPIDKTENGIGKGVMSQIKDNAWIGATIAVQNKTEARVVVCGPRWRNNNTISNNTNWYMNGICYTTLARNANAFEREAEEQLLPLTKSGNQVVSKNNINMYNYGVGQTGFSLHMNSRDPMSIAMGSPGVHNCKGHVILAQVNNSLLDIVIPPLAEDHGCNYFGYAITAGCYFDKRNIYYASSAPRAAQMNGLILVFNFLKSNRKNMFVRTIIYGEQYGEYFGAALTSCDVNNDGRHELIVGAPQWSRDMDEGRVYIFTTRYYNFERNFEKLQTIEGEIVGGRFGSAVMCLGDIDYDGYGDIAVGAPYEEDSGGAVYIFNGNENGISRKYSQRLVGSQFSSTMRGFGISISEPRDVNRDNQSDIAVGAYLSNEVVLLKSMTVVTVNVTFKSRPKLFKNIKFFKLDIAMIFKGAPECLYVNTIFKIDQTYRRASYSEMKYNDEYYSWSYHMCRECTIIISPEIHLKKNIQNMINPLEMSISLKLDDANIKKCCESCVIDKRRSKTEDVIELPFLHFENDTDAYDHVSDLGITLSTDSSPNNRYVIGNYASIMLHIDISNRGKLAYQTKLHIVTEVLMLASLPPECIENSRNILDVICNVGDPLTTNKRLTLQLDMSMVRYKFTEIKLQASVSTQSNEINLNDNTHVIIIYFDVDVGLTIVGKAQENMYYSYANEERILNGIRFQHFYEVQNFGISPVEEAVLTLKIPTHIWRDDTGRIAIVNINNIIGKMDGHELHCNSRQPEFSFALEKTVSMHKIIKKSSSIANKSTNAKFNINVPAETRTFYVNCTSNAVHCAQFDCRLRPFLNSLSVAKFLVTLDLHRSKFPDDMMKDKDIIFYVTEGSINIIQPYGTQRDGNKSDILVATTFLDIPIAEQITTSCIVVSVFLGTVLLICLIGCLKQVGFFHRERIDLVEALNAETDLYIKIV